MSTRKSGKPWGGKRNVTHPQGGGERTWAEVVREKMQKRRPLANIQALKDRAEAKGYHLTMSREKDGEWVYTLEAKNGEPARFPWGGSNDWDMMLIAAEMAVDALPD